MQVKCPRSKLDLYVLTCHRYCVIFPSSGQVGQLSTQSMAVSGCLHSSGSGKNPILHLGETMAQINQAKSMQEL